MRNSLFVVLLASLILLVVGQGIFFVPAFEYLLFLFLKMFALWIIVKPVIPVQTRFASNAKIVFAFSLRINPYAQHAKGQPRKFSTRHFAQWLPLSQI